MVHSRTLIRGLAVALCALLLAPAIVYAQGVTTGDLAGKVLDPNGDPVAGARIEAELLTTGTQYADTTDQAGRFSMLNAKVGGPYAVKATVEGFQPAELGNVYVRLGVTTELVFNVKLEAVTGEEILVTASNPLISSSRFGAASSVSEGAIDALPTVERALADFARTNPLVVMSAENDQVTTITIAGRNNRYNNIQIDGAVNNDLFGLAASGTPGGQTESQPISIDAIQELQLVIAPFDVRQGGFTGGGLNAITKSGTNAFKGSVYGYYFDDSLVGTGGDQVGEIGTFEEKQYGFTLGGPVQQDKIFFFVNGELARKNKPAGWSMDGASGQWFQNGALIPEAERFSSYMLDTYGYDIGGFSEVTRPTDSDKLFVRFDFNLNNRNHLTARHNYVKAENLIIYPASYAYQFPNDGYSFKNETNSSVVQLDSVFGDDMFNQLRVTYQTIKDRRAGDVPFPFVDIENVGNTSADFRAGTERFSTANSLDQDILEITDDFTFFYGDHEITVGTHNEIFSFKNLFIQESYGAYWFDDLDAFEAGIANEYHYTFSNDDSPYDEFDVMQLGFYAGDQWRAKPNLTLTFGLRLDMPLFPDEPNHNPLVEQVFGYNTSDVPDSNQLWSPRLGFNWDVLGDAKHQVRGGLGIFTGRSPYVWISNNYGRTGLEQTTITAYGDITFVPDPNNQPTDVGFPTGSQEINVIDPDFEFPQVVRYNLAYDAQLPWWDLVGSVEAVRSESRNEILYKRIDMFDSGEETFDGRPLYEFDPNVSNDFSGAYLLTNTDKGESTNVTFKLEKPFNEGIWGFVAYTWGDSKVINDGSSSRAVSNWQYNEAIDPNNPSLSRSDFEVEHRFTASLSYVLNRQTDWPTTISAFYNHQSGRPFSVLLYDSYPSVNGDGVDDNDLMYIPSGPDDVIITNGTWAQLEGFISRAGLTKYEGRIAERNASIGPWTHSLDVHLGQKVPVGYGDMELTLDIFNFMNMLDSDSGVVRYVNFGSIFPVRYRGVDEDTGRPIYELFQVVTDPDNSPLYTVDNLRSRWRLKVGVRYSF